MTDAELEQQFDWIEWRKPILVRIFDGTPRLCCRYCIAQRGLSAVDLGRRGFNTEAEFQQHLQEQHSQNR